MRLDSVLNINPGCKIILGSFDSRQLIAKILGEICRTNVPPWQIDDNGNAIRCHIKINDLKNQQSTH